ncbi:DNA mismatch repair endonuclease MutL [Maridesulfovibrio hydrothermalis]|uniref:DNA mismatch repair protein MutL n=1 Tax=Maridesulfovibrio hydrothermalis AM13 = DSM 14728 TaxID=1121451 RepID=L0RA06_9BACT|nr:DNA mismatch repair endonuclease MutL [Maridesulfovibrio hydrothermalis]CCO23618.1 DNA mismatch repair protein mutL [Maridesulfovibrio hydrothermalis AM13 = DSM 14728]
MSNPKIHVLPAALRNQIAAGEVVERPSSVVKELVENSIDAGSTQVDVIIDRGGQGLISVKDNGIGVAADELRLAVTRHATSKIANIDDLIAVTSFGFRGEALPSIGSVSRFKMTSCQKGATEGWFIFVEGAEVADEGPAAIPGGTSVEVRDLFYNVPARLKFLKTESTEARRCNQVLFKMSLANLEAGFSFTSNGKEQFRLAQGQSLPERLAVFWPRNICESMLEFSHEVGEMKVHGCAGIPAVAQGRGDRIVMFVNGRSVQDKLLLSAIRGAYKGRLISREYPQAVLFLELPPEMVDVNVHPAKMEVRFQEERSVFSIIRNGIAQALSRYELGIVEGSHSTHGNEQPFTQSRDTAKKNSAPSRASLPIEPAAKFSSWNEFKNTDFSVEEEDSSGASIVAQPARSDSDFTAGVSADRCYEPEMIREEVGNYGTRAEIKPSDRQPETHFAQAASPFKVSGSSIEYLGQVADTYLVLKLPNGTLGLLDQHAAHERIIYENMRTLRTRGESRPLAIPIELALHPSEVQRVQELWEELQAAGFMLELEGGQNLSMRGIPPGLETGEAKEYLRGAVDGQAKTLDDLWIMLSCKSAIKANQPLAVDECLALLEAWVQCPQREYCPHGRPVLVSWSSLDMEKLFKRK